MKIYKPEAMVLKLIIIDGMSERHVRKYLHKMPSIDIVMRSAKNTLKNAVWHELEAEIRKSLTYKSKRGTRARSFI